MLTNEPNLEKRQNHIMQASLVEESGRLSKERKEQRSMASSVITKPIISSDSHIMEPPDTMASSAVATSAMLA